MAPEEAVENEETQDGAEAANPEGSGDGQDAAGSTDPTLLSQLLVPESLVRMAIGVLVLGGLTAGIFFLIVDVIGPRIGPVDNVPYSGTAADVEVAPAIEAPGMQWVVDDIVLNPAGTNGKRFLRLGLAIETKDGAPLIAELDSRRAQMRDLLIRKFSSRTIEELGDPVVREEIRLTCIEEINARLAGGEISDMYFTDYVLQ
jgi:flagellar protein FliL